MLRPEGVIQVRQPRSTTQWHQPPLKKRTPEEESFLSAILRKAPSEAKDTTIKITKASLSMQEAADVFSRDPDHNMTSEEAKRFVSAVMDYKAFVDN